MLSVRSSTADSSQAVLLIESERLVGRVSERLARHESERLADRESERLARHESVRFPCHKSERLAHRERREVGGSWEGKVGLSREREVESLRE